MVCASPMRIREETAVTSLEALGWDSFFDCQVTDDERARRSPARVVWHARGHYRLSTGRGEWRGHLAGTLRHTAATPADLPVVGDWVLAASGGDGTATIRRRLGRRSSFSRQAAGRAAAEQIVAANVDTVLIVTSLNRDFSPRRLERYLALTWESGATPVVVLNKADLTDDAETWRREMAPVAQGVTLLVTSAFRGDGMPELHDVVRRGGTTVLVGSSGVGKSTIINSLAGERRQDVLPVRAADDRGRHGTTARHLFCLPGGGILIDTPGLRELQLWDADSGLEHAFEDVQSLAARCRFRDCSHGAEPGCAVAAAVARGELTADRIDSYRSLKEENEYLRTRHDEGARQERKRQSRQIARAIRLHYKLRRR
jgi:ribosome biogenesis GTPase